MWCSGRRPLLLVIGEWLFVALNEKNMDKKSKHSLWLESIRGEEDAREKERRKALREVENALDFMAKRYSWEETYIFGSVTKKGRYSKGSDIDIAVKGLDKFDFYSFVGDISAFLERPVDVVNLEECPFGASIESGGLKWNPKKK
jgi:uncharacterized protein